MPVAGNNSSDKNVDEHANDIDIDIDDDSDYGWDLSLEEDVHELLNAATTATTEATVKTEEPSSSARARLLVPVVSDSQLTEDASASQLGPLAAAAGANPMPHHDFVADDDDPSAAAVLDAALLSFNADYPDLSQTLADLNSELASSANVVPKGKGKAVESLATTVPGAADASAGATSANSTSPLAQFRAYPMKPLTVSDLTAGAWCELQYEYTLTRLPGGRRTRTPAMKAGSKVHQKLEDEVHTTVPITVKSPQDFLGVKIWNMVHGLRTLRETGLTRELDIWGLVDGGGGPIQSKFGLLDRQLEVVNGVIDALSYENPDPAAQPQPKETKASPKKGSPRKKSGSKAAAATSFSTEATLSMSQITDYFPSSPLDPFSQQEQANTTPVIKEEPGQTPSPPRKIYITDVKTRESARLPSGAAARPAKIQLFLYHRFLRDLASGNFRFDVVFERYKVDEYARFSEDFLLEMHIDPLFIELTHDYHNNLYWFVFLLRHEIALTFPQGADTVGDVVAVEYRQRPRGDVIGGRCIGTNVIPVDEDVLNRYLANYLAWWRGARAPVGVDIEEASLKCGYCEFVDDCDWRQKMDEERMKKARAKMAAARGQAS
ncbi:hypothetical protein Sste5346_001471 [Sporothrix stenoceras]|uniref:Defects in morphology protein 1 n=1 Tax=Sporothrix stenoceras TaxID=5173 RepID=A0ABR3ZQX3_9PEZI